MYKTFHNRIFPSQTHPESNIKGEKNQISFLLFWLILSLSYALIFITIEFAGSPFNSIRGFLNLFLQWMVVGGAASMILGLLSLSRILFSAGFPILLFLSTVAAYYRLTMGLSITPNIIELTVVNEWSTWATVISIPLVLTGILSLLISGAVIWIRWKKVRKAAHPWIWLLVFMLGIITPVKLVARFKAPVSARIPYSFYYSVKDWLSNRKSVAEKRTTYDNTPVSVPKEAPDVIFIIGESLRPDHLSINGYPRTTTPNLEKDSAVVSFTNITTDYLYTHVSVPHLLTRAIPGKEEAAYQDQSFISLFDKAGYNSTWISNQDEVNTYAYFMHEADSLIQCNLTKSFYDYDKWLDSDMLPHIGNILRNSSKPELMVLHTIGSHWWFASHYPDSLATFTPEIDSRILSELSHEQIINSYDNTILATDDFIYRVISALRNRNAVVIYISDHGEALGENGNYLHADSYPQLRNTACLVWTSPKYASLFPEKVEALKQNRNTGFSSEVIFHSVLDAAAVSTPVLDKSKSIFHKK